MALSHAPHDSSEHQLPLVAIYTLSMVKTRNADLHDIYISNQDRMKLRKSRIYSEMPLAIKWTAVRYLCFHSIDYPGASKTPAALLLLAFLVFKQHPD